jgi:hypothetical protein
MDAERRPTDHHAADAASSAVGDANVEQAVLAFLLAEHPLRPTVPEVLLALGVEEGDFPREDSLKRAIRELRGAGLLHRHDGFLAPTRAALYFDALEMD